VFAIQMTFFAFLAVCATASAASLRSVSLPFPKDVKKPGAPAGAPAAATVDNDDDSASRALEAAIMGIGIPKLPTLPEISVPKLQKGANSEPLKQQRMQPQWQQMQSQQQAKFSPKSKPRNQQQVQPLRQRQQQVRQAKVSSRRQGSKQGAQDGTRSAQYPSYQYYAPPGVTSPPQQMVTASPPGTGATLPPLAVALTAAPYASSTVVATVTTTAAPYVAPQVTAAPELDLGTWKYQMEQRLHSGLSSEITILNTLMTHQTQTHKQLIRFKQVLTVLGQKYQAQQQLSQQQQAKIASLEQQLAGMTQEVSSLNTKFETYKKHYDEKWAGSNTAIESLYKKTADAVGTMTALHSGVQQQFQAMAPRVQG